MADHPKEQTPKRSLPVLILGALIGLIGIVLAAGGIWLAVLGGSVYYLLVGLALMASGFLLVRGQAVGHAQRHAPRATPQPAQPRCER